ncbi:hypothetical protein O3597_22825 [Verrucosispora sp. WMMA2044]|uniref:hypothetical protein n=1 Tax=Verrucosispora sp. WMMA2044 TaxID=3016419 RepID=UPI00248C7332|nr:hypothetical protein [Verrucosispora sp. WMMA2044]WBB47927.1 hypothetical protein O3597_22825 [Verrucosispora sp. WMMA2044]
MRRWTRLRVGLVMLAMGAVLAPPAAATADPLPTGAVIATVWANQPAAAEYTVDNGWSWSSTEGDIVVRRTGTGAYTVELQHAATSTGVAHVVAYGGGPVHCTVASWYRSLLGGNHLLIQVRCFAATGAPVDSRFVATFTNRQQIHQGRLAWFTTDQATPVGLRTIPAGLRYDSTGGTISYERLGTGHYRFRMNPNPASESGAPIFPMTHVTALGGNAVNCQIDWPDGREVRCANAAGNDVDARFAVTYGSRVDLLGHSAGPRFASGTLYGDNITGGFISGDSYNSTLPGYGGASGTLLGTGRYQMIFSGTRTTFGTAFVNAHLGILPGSRPRGHCVLAGWGRSGANTVVLVNCYGWLGVPANLNARISYTTWPGGTAV